MKDTLKKMRCLIAIKTQLLKVLGEDLTTANRKLEMYKGATERLATKIEELSAQNAVLRRQQGWWQHQDEALSASICQEAEDLVTKYGETERTVVIPVALVVNNDDK